MVRARRNCLLRIFRHVLPPCQERARQIFNNSPYKQHKQPEESSADKTIAQLRKELAALKKQVLSQAAGWYGL